MDRRRPTSRTRRPIRDQKQSPSPAPLIALGGVALVAIIALYIGLKPSKSPAAPPAASQERSAAQFAPQDRPPPDLKKGPERAPAAQPAPAAAPPVEGSKRRRKLWDEASELAKTGEAKIAEAKTAAEKKDAAKEKQLLKEASDLLKGALDKGEQFLAPVDAREDLNSDDVQRGYSDRMHQWRKKYRTLVF
jgi:type IV secretory pathway VirB10-like protein